MPGYVIHLAVAEEYLKKHNTKKENYDEFIDGVLAPDGVKDKSITHYGRLSAEANLEKFLNEHSIESSFDRGYFLHLLTDYLFYNKYVEVFSNDMYNDYDILNKYLIEKYNVELLDKIKDKVFFKEGTLKILNKDLCDKMIKEISDLDIDEVANEVKINPIKWTKIRPLKYL